MMHRREDGVFEKTEDMSFSLCDFTGKCKPSALLRITSDLAGEDYHMRGLPHDRLWNEGYVFLVSRVSFRLKRGIGAEERVTFATYEHSVSGPFFVRDYTVSDESGEQIISGRSEWIVCDPQTRRIIRPSKFPYPPQTHEDRQVDCAAPQRLKLPEEMEKLGERRVVYSDLDGNGHVNNSVYADIACDVLPISLLCGQICEFSINFVQEAKLGDVIELRGFSIEETVCVAGYIGDALCFECSFVFEQ